MRDSELAEGSIWEALDKASFYGLGHLIAIVDVTGSASAVKPTSAET